MRLFHLFAATAMLTLAACSQDYMESNESAPISFLTEEIPEHDNATRGAQVSSISSFGVSAAVYDNSASFSTAACGSFFYNQQLQPNVNTPYFWPVAAKRMAFYAYYPYGNANITVSSAATEGRPVYSYTVPESVASHVDFMTAEVTDRQTSNTSPVALSFGHRLSSIRFVLTNNMTNSVTVNRIKVAGMKYTGTYTTGSSWSLSGSANTTSSRAFTFSPAVTVTSGSTVDITGSSNHFMVLPQTVSSGTVLFELNTTQNGVIETYSYTLDSNLTLEMGKSITYQLTLRNKALTVNPVSVVDWVPE